MFGLGKKQEVLTPICATFRGAVENGWFDDFVPEGTMADIRYALKNEDRVQEVQQKLANIPGDGTEFVVNGSGDYLQTFNAIADSVSAQRTQKLNNGNEYIIRHWGEPLHCF